MKGSAASYSSQEAVKLAGITYRQLDHWCRVGLVFPAVGARGSGSRRRWSEEDVARLRRIALAARLCANSSLIAALDTLDSLEAELAALRPLEPVA